MMTTAVYIAMVGSIPSPWFLAAIVISMLAGLACLGIVMPGRAGPTRTEYGSGTSLHGALRKYGAIMKRNTMPVGPGFKISNALAEERQAVAIEGGNFFNEELAGHSQALASLSMRELMAATDADDLGTLSGTLVLQRSLPLFRYEYPILASLFTDFSPAPGVLNQTEDTRILIKPSVQTTTLRVTQTAAQ